MPQQQQPSPGRIVHYLLPETTDAPVVKRRAALITSDWPGRHQNLTVFLDQRHDLPDQNDAFYPLYRVWSAEFDETGTKPGCWSWPPRTDALLPVVSFDTQTSPATTIEPLGIDPPPAVEPADQTPPEQAPPASGE